MIRKKKIGVHVNIAQRLLPAVLLSLILSSACFAQNVTGYGGMSEPLLFLLREPAIHAELKLTQIQRGRLTNFNHTFDGSLLASRISPRKNLKRQ